MNANPEPRGEGKFFPVTRTKCALRWAGYRTKRQGGLNWYIFDRTGQKVGQFYNLLDDDGFDFTTDLGFKVPYNDKELIRIATKYGKEVESDLSGSRV